MFGTEPFHRECCDNSGIWLPSGSVSGIQPKIPPSWQDSHRIVGQACDRGERSEQGLDLRDASF